MCLTHTALHILLNQEMVGNSKYSVQETLQMVPIRSRLGLFWRIDIVLLSPWKFSHFENDPLVSAFEYH